MVEVTGKEEFTFQREAGIRTLWHPMQGHRDRHLLLECPVAAGSPHCFHRTGSVPVITQVPCICGEILAQGRPRDQSRARGRDHRSTLCGGTEGTRGDSKPTASLKEVLLLGGKSGLGMNWSVPCWKWLSHMTIKCHLLQGPSAQLCSCPVSLVPCWEANLT